MRDYTMGVIDPSLLAQSSAKQAVRAEEPPAKAAEEELPEEKELKKMAEMLM